MSVAFKCDWCGDYFEHGFKGSWKKSVTSGKNQFDINLKISKCSHLCKKCWPKFCKLFHDELKNTHIDRKKAGTKSVVP